MTDRDAVLHVTLRDGTRCTIRPIRAEDKLRLAAGLERLSARSRHLRFNSVVDHLSASQLRYLTEIDYADHMAWGAEDTDAPDSPGIAVARYVRLRDEPDVAEAAITVADDYQGRGLGTILIALLGRSASEAGITTLRSYVLASNTAMLEILKQLGVDVTDVGGGLLQLDWSLPTMTEDAPDTPAGQVLRQIAVAPMQLGLEPPVWLEDQTATNP